MVARVCSVCCSALVAETVLRRSLTPVLVVPHAMAKTGNLARVDTVICAVDFAESAQRVVEYAVSVAATTGARLVVAHVLEWSEESDSLPSPDATAFLRPKMTLLRASIR